MGEVAVGDLYDQAAKSLNPIIDTNAFYVCRYCQDLKISGKLLGSSNDARSHAAAHRIAFEALMEASSMLICPICDEPQHSAEALTTATFFDCLFNDLDLVAHLLRDHEEMLLDELVGDFGEPEYLLTTFSSSTGKVAQNSSDSPQYPNRILHIESVGQCSSSTCSNTNVEEVQIASSSQAQDVHVIKAAQPSTSAPSAKQKRAVPTSRISCTQCSWQESVMDDVMRRRQALGFHVRTHIIAENKHLFNQPNCLSSDLTILRNMDVALKRFYGKDQPSDLSTVENAKALEKKYSEILISLFGVCYPLAIRILHGSSGNPFKVKTNNPYVVRKKSYYKSLNYAMKQMEAATEADRMECDGSSDLISVLSAKQLPSKKVLKSQTIILCDRIECGNMIINGGDRHALAKHIAAHIRHDEMRLQRIVRPMACGECGMACYSPIGYIYHVAREHIFDKRSYDGAEYVLLAHVSTIFDTVMESILSGRVRHDPLIRWRAGPMPVDWVAYFCIDEEEGEEQDWSDSTTASETWRTAWTQFLNEDINFYAAFSFFEQHPFVPVVVRKYKRKISILDHEKMNAFFSCILNQLHVWSKSSIRYDLSSPERWSDLEKLQSDRKALNNQANSSTTVDVINVAQEREYINVGMNRSSLSLQQPTKEEAKDQEYVKEEAMKCENDDEDNVDEVSEVVQDEKTTVDSPIVSVEESLESGCDHQDTIKSGVLEDVQLQDTEFGGSSLDPDEMKALAQLAEYFPSDGGATTLPAGMWECRFCEDVILDSEETVNILSHTSAHACLESLAQSKLNVHNSWTTKLFCPFCDMELDLSEPRHLIIHMEDEHSRKSIEAYEWYLNKKYPCKEFFVLSSEEQTQNQADSIFALRCKHNNICKETIRFVDSIDPATTVAKHVLNHVRNDDGLSLDKEERALLVNAMMMRLTSCQHPGKAISTVANSLAKDIKVCGVEMLSFLQHNLQCIFETLFGIHWGYAMELVFPRRAEREQCGARVYPPCICRLCSEKELPMTSIEKRGRIFIAQVQPIISHVMRHMENNELSEQTQDKVKFLMWRAKCPMDGSRFKYAIAALKHVFDRHLAIVEMNAFELILISMGLLEVFNETLTDAFGTQAWQIQEALGLSFERIPYTRPVFLKYYSTRAIIAEPIRSTKEVDSATSIEAIQFARKKALITLPTDSAAVYEAFLDTEERTREVASAVAENIIKAQVEVKKEEPDVIFESSSTMEVVSVESSDCGVDTITSFEDDILMVQSSTRNGSAAPEQSSIVLNQNIGKQLPAKPKKIRQSRDIMDFIQRETLQPQPEYRSKMLSSKKIGTRSVASAVAAALDTIPHSSKTAVTVEPVRRSDEPTINTAGFFRSFMMTHDEDSTLAEGSSEEKEDTSSVQKIPATSARPKRQYIRHSKQNADMIQQIIRTQIAPCQKSATVAPKTIVSAQKCETIQSAKLPAKMMKKRDVRSVQSNIAEKPSSSAMSRMIPGRKFAAIRDSSGEEEESDLSLGVITKKPREEVPPAPLGIEAMQQYLLSLQR